MHQSGDQTNVILRKCCAPSWFYLQDCTERRSEKNKMKFTLQDIDKMYCEEQICYCLALEVGEDILLE